MPIKINIIRSLLGPDALIGPSLTICLRSSGLPILQGKYSFSSVGFVLNNMDINTCLYDNITRSLTFAPSP
jgi:hypothetical protein